ncbi:MAG: hypothetical protein U0136_09875 [Bdellovibrionota bacterium]
MFKQTQIVSLAWLLLAGSAVGCAGGGGSDDSVPTTSISVESGAAADSAVAVSQAARALGATLVHSSITRTNPDQIARVISASCPGSGTATLNGTISDISAAPPRSVSSSGTIELQNCNGWTGTLTYDGTVTGSSGQFVVAATTGGQLIGSCDVDVESLAFDGLESSSGSSLSGNVTGNLVADCDSARVACSWLGVSLNDTEALKDGCAKL